MLIEDRDANYPLWKEEQAYVRSLCSDFSKRIPLAKAHRDHAKNPGHYRGF